ncbi:MAG: Ig-like domain-containing protein [Gemmatimonadales bacterium]|nr:Ig-like domain-containing protein [Gemmatimonadales bacterium]
MMRRLFPAALTLSLLACDSPEALPPDGGGGGGGGGSTPLVVDSTRPADAATHDFERPLVAWFNQALQSSSITVGNVGLRTGAGVDVPRRLLGLSSSRSLETVAALLPGESYSLVLSTGLAGSTGGRLAAPDTVRFTTRSVVATSVGSIDSLHGSRVGLAQDSTGRLHLTYGEASTGDLMYASCAAGCSTAAGWTVVRVDSIGVTGQQSSVAVDPDARVHVVYRDETRQELRYATCLAPCTDPADFVRVTIEGTTTNVGTNPVIVVGPTGRLHVTFFSPGATVFRYTTCLLNCTSATQWSGNLIDGNNAYTGVQSAMVVDPAGRLHVVYTDDGVSGLRYATCASGCGDITTTWQTAAVTGVLGLTAYPSIAVDSAGGVHVAYQGLTDTDLRYAVCEEGCLLGPTQWTDIDLLTFGNVGGGTALAVDGRGRLHLTYADREGVALGYATCASGCDAASRWRSAPIDVRTGLPAAPAMLLGRDGRLRTAYLADSLRFVRVLE